MRFPRRPKEGDTVHVEGARYEYRGGMWITLEDEEEPEVAAPSIPMGIPAYPIPGLVSHDPTHIPQYTSITEALNDGCRTIVVMPGTYKEDLTFRSTVSLCGWTAARGARDHAQPTSTHIRTTRDIKVYGQHLFMAAVADDITIQGIEFRSKGEAMCDFLDHNAVTVFNDCVFSGSGSDEGTVAIYMNSPKNHVPLAFKSCYFDTPNDDVLEVGSENDSIAFEGCHINGRISALENASPIYMDNCVWHIPGPLQISTNFETRNVRIYGCYEIVKTHQSWYASNCEFECSIQTAAGAGLFWSNVKVGGKVRIHESSNTFELCTFDSPIVITGEDVLLPNMWCYCLFLDSIIVPRDNVSQLLFRHSTFCNAQIRVSCGDPSELVMRIEQCILENEHGSVIDIQCEAAPNESHIEILNSCIAHTAESFVTQTVGDHCEAGDIHGAGNTIAGDSVPELGPYVSVVGLVV